MLEGCCDCLQDAPSVRHHLVIVESQDAISFGSEKSVTSNIALLMLRVEMLPTVNFDDQVGIVTNEIGNVRSNGRLPSEACADKSFRPHRIPNDPLGLG